VTKRSQTLSFTADEVSSSRAEEGVTGEQNEGQRGPLPALQKAASGEHAGLFTGGFVRILQVTIETVTKCQV